LTVILLSLVAAIGLYVLYFAARVARLGTRPAAFLDAGYALPSWSIMFLTPALAIAALGMQRHLFFVSHYGLQAVHLGVGLVLVSAAILLVWNRLWFATRVAGFSTPGEGLGRYYDSIALRVVVMMLTFVFVVPYAADMLSSTAILIERATEGFIPRASGVWMLAIMLAVPAIIGGWLSIVISLAMIGVLTVYLLPTSIIVAEILLPGQGFPQDAIGVIDGVLWDRLPGVIQYSAGIGKEIPAPGIFTTVAISSTSLALIGIVYSPVTLYLGQTVRAGGAFGITSVWLTGGLAAGLLVLGMPYLAARLGDGPLGFASSLFEFEPLLGAGFLLLLVASGILAVSFFVTGGTIIFIREMVLRYLLPELSPQGQRLSARIGLGFSFFIVALAASFAPTISAIVGSIALPMAVQLLPAILGLTFFAWISRGAILAGLTIGALIVLFTEPLGLVVFEALFVELPWGRWPLTIHSAAWGLVFNVLIVLLSSAATLKSPERLERDRFHRAMAMSMPAQGNWGRSVFWSVMLLWGFLAYGPGAILGNTFFSQPIFTDLEATLGIPSIWVWQILFWLIGVMIIWWLAYKVGLGRTTETLIKPIEMGSPDERRIPDWLSSGLTRVTKKSA